jgi:hypothetical protein
MVPLTRCDAKTIIGKASCPHVVIPGLTRNPLAFQYENGFLLEFIPTCRGRNDTKRGASAGRVSVVDYYFSRMNQFSFHDIFERHAAISGET